jgi:hypothetical protein
MVNGHWLLPFGGTNQAGNNNIVKVSDLTHLHRPDLNINWNDEDEKVEAELNKVQKKATMAILDNTRGDIRSLLPLIVNNGNLVRQSRLNLYRNVTKEEENKKIISGFPLKDDRHTRVKAPYGFVDGSFIGFMDDATPVRVKQDSLNRMSDTLKRVWFRLDNDFKGINKCKAFNGPADNRSYCAYDSNSAKATFTWFAITKALNGVYPVWANQYDLWPPQIKPKLEKYWYSLCFAFVLAENRCVVTKFEANNPVPDAPEVFVDNPLCPTNKNSFWCTTLDGEIVNEPDAAFRLVEKIKELYRYWNLHYCKGQYIENVGLQNEPYFKYFDYPDFLTPHSGLIQIRKYAEQEGLADMLELFIEVIKLTKLVKAELHRLLVDEFKYFE